VTASLSPFDLIARHLRLPDGRSFGDAMADYQRADFEQLFAPDAAPNVWISRPRGGSKTTDIAAMAVADLLSAPDRSRLYAVAGDQDQAGLLLDAVATWLANSPDLEGSLTIQRDRVSNPLTGSVLIVLSSDAPTALGLTPWRIFLDEIAAWPTGAMFGSMFSASHKLPGCRVIAMTTAGSPTSWAYELWKNVKQSARWLVLERRELAPWSDTEQVEEARRLLPSGVFARYYDNAWTAADEAPFTLEQIERATDYGREPATGGDGNHLHFVGVDLGLVNDATVISVVRQDRDRRAHKLVYTWYRQGSRESPVPIAEVEAELRSIQRRFGPTRIFCDPWQMKALIQAVPGVEEFAFTTKSMQPLSSSLLVLIREGRLRLLDDPNLRGELLGLTIVEKSYGWRIEAASGHDDRVMALALAAHHADTEIVELWVG